MTIIEGRERGFVLLSFTILNVIFSNIAHNVSRLLEEEKVRRKEQLIISGQKKLQKRKEKLANNLVFLQEVCPSYVSKLIKTYFEIRIKHTIDINARYLILLEGKSPLARMAVPI